MPTHNPRISRKALRAAVGARMAALDREYAAKEAAEHAQKAAKPFTWSASTAHSETVGAHFVQSAEDSMRILAPYVKVMENRVSVKVPPNASSAVRYAVHEAFAGSEHPQAWKARNAFDEWVGLTGGFDAPVRANSKRPCGNPRPKRHRRNGEYLQHVEIYDRSRKYIGSILLKVNTAAPASYPEGPVALFGGMWHPLKGGTAAVRPYIVVGAELAKLAMEIVGPSEYRKNQRGAKGHSRKNPRGDIILTADAIKLDRYPENPLTLSLKPVAKSMYSGDTGLGFMGPGNVQWMEEADRPAAKDASARIARWMKHLDAAQVTAALDKLGARYYGSDDNEMRRMTLRTALYERMVPYVKANPTKKYPRRHR